MKKVDLPVTRGASLHGYLDLARKLGVDGTALMRRARLTPHCADDPDAPVGLPAICRLFELTAQASGREDFALLLAAPRRISNLGPIGLVASQEPTVMQALAVICRYLSLLNSALQMQIETQEKLVVVREDMLLPAKTPSRQVTEFVVALLHRTIAELLGPHWHPVKVCFMHRAPADLQAHRKFFGAPVEFGGEFNGMVCRTEEMHQTRHGTDRELARFAVRHLDQSLAGQRPGMGTTRSVCHWIAAMLPGGHCTVEQLAAHLGVDRRTVHRHLAAHGETFKGLLEAVRKELAQRLVEGGEIPFSEVAVLLGFAAPSAFSTWFSKAFGCTPTAFRNGHANRK